LGRWHSLSGKGIDRLGCANFNATLRARTSSSLNYLTLLGRIRRLDYQRKRGIARYYFR
jgi:hypothetical protein